MSNPRLCLALDGCTPQEALAWIERTRAHIGVYKVGLELFLRGGFDLVAACHDVGAPAIFLDLKLHDIPRTVARAVEAAARPGVRWLTVHSAGGAAMLRAAQAAAEQGGIRLLGVTVLTSLDPEDAHRVGLVALEDAIERRAVLVAQAGLAGLVCGATEVARIKTAHPHLHCVTPGIRWPDDPVDDQRRTADPVTAQAAGSDMLVLGRMITHATHPEQALGRLAALLS